MRFIAYALLTLFTSAAASARDDFRFFPGSAVPQGGTPIQIWSTTYHFTAPRVFFGGVPSPHVALVDPFSITAVAPAHGVDIVSVTVADGGFVLNADRKFAFAPELEEILIPIALQPVAGSHGTRWMTEIAVYNDSDDSVSIDPEICSFIGSPSFCSGEVRRIQPRSSMLIEPSSTWANDPAMFILPPADHADRLHFNVRLHETSRDSNGPGTQIPVVRTRDFQNKQVWLVSVPTSPQCRATLRVFTRGGLVAVRVKDDDTGELISERQIRRLIATDVDSFGTVTMSDLLSPAEVRSHAKVRIEVESASPVWAMVTLTDNETQRVQIFTPQ